MGEDGREIIGSREVTLDFNELEEKLGEDETEDIYALALQHSVLLDAMDKIDACLNDARQCLSHDSAEFHIDRARTILLETASFCCREMSSTKEDGNG